MGKRFFERVVALLGKSDTPLSCLKVLLSRKAWKVCQQELIKPEENQLCDADLSGRTKL